MQQYSNLCVISRQIDIDECKEGIDLCLPGLETCVNLRGAYRCNKETETADETTTTRNTEKTKASTTTGVLTTTVRTYIDSSKCPNGYTYNPQFKSCLGNNNENTELFF